jgi:hypothetical protein
VAKDSEGGRKRKQTKRKERRMSKAQSAMDAIQLHRHGIFPMHPGFRAHAGGPLPGRASSTALAVRACCPER